MTSSSSGRSGDALAGQPGLAQRVLQRLAAAVLGVLAALAPEELADLRARLGGGDQLEPVARGAARRLGGEDLDEVARLQGVGQRHDAPVDLRAHAAVADVGVDVVGEVERRGAGGQVAHLALGREDVDLVGVEVGAQGIEELARVVRLPLPVHHPRDPGRLVARAVLLVEPVGGDAELGRRVHRVGPDLDLERLALGTDHRRVQALVHVELGHRDVVLEAPGQRLPERVDDAHRPVAVLHRLDQHPHRGEVVDLVELLALAGHLLVDRVEVLRPPGDLHPEDPDVLERGRRASARRPR